MMRPIGQYLTEFRPDGPAAMSPLPPAELPSFSDLRPEPEPPDFESTDFDAMPGLEDEAFPSLDEAESFPQADAPPEPDLATTVAALEADHAAALAEARARWATEEGAAIAERIGQAFAELETRLADALAPLLEPFLAHAARMKALAQLHSTLGTLLGGGETRAVTVSGPADLVAALRDSYGDRPGVSFAEADVPDVTVALGDTRIRSQLRAWARKLDSALGATA